MCRRTLNCLKNGSPLVTLLTVIGRLKLVFFAQGHNVSFFVVFEITFWLHETTWEELPILSAYAHWNISWSITTKSPSFIQCWSPYSNCAANVPEVMIRQLVKATWKRTWINRNLFLILPHFYFILVNHIHYGPFTPVNKVYSFAQITNNLYIYIYTLHGFLHKHQGAPRS